MRRSLMPVVLSILALVVAACGRADGPDAAQPAPAGTSTAAAVPIERCANPQDGYRLSYPEGWHTNPADILPTCTVFDTDRILPERPLAANVETVRRMLRTLEITGADG